MMGRGCATCCLILIPFVTTFCTPFRFNHIGLNEGLSQSTVLSVTQDHFGFLWFGTQDGLNRYDGSQFTVYRHVPGDSGSLSDTFVWRLLTARDGSVWAGTFRGGVARFDQYTGSFHAYRHREDDSTSLPSDNVTAIFEDTDSTVWVGTWGGGLAHLDPVTGRCVRYRHIPEHPFSLSSDKIGAILRDQNGNLWVGTWNGVSMMPAGGGTFRRYALAPPDRQVNVWTILECTDGDLFFGTYGQGMFRFEPSHDVMMPCGLGGGRINALIEEGDGAVLAGTPNGLVRYDRASRRWESVSRDDSRHPPDGTSILSLLETSEGTLLLGTYGAGVLVGSKTGFLTISSDGGARGGLGGNNVRAIVADERGNVWVGTEGTGLSYLNRKTGRVVSFRHEDALRQSVVSDNILSLLLRRSGDLWVGTQNAGISVLSHGTTTFRSVRLNNEKDPGADMPAIMAMCERNDGAVWCGTEGGGVFLVDSSGVIIRHYGATPSRPGTLSNNYVWSMFVDSRDDLWVGTWGGGINRLRHGADRFEIFPCVPSDTTTPGDNSILCITEDDAHDIWFGTLGGGVTKWSRADSRFQRLTTRQGLADDIVHAIQFSAGGDLWASSNRGICRFNPHTGEGAAYDKRDGLQSNEFNQGASCRTADGWMFFGNIGGLCAFHPDSLIHNRVIPPVVLTGLRVFDRSIVPGQSIWTARHVTLGYDENFFSFRYAALSYRASEKSQFQYLLEGFDREWVSAGTRREAHYTNVPPGDYVFQVRGSNDDGVWNTEGVRLAITIVPPYWQTWWFRAALVLFGAGLLYGLYRFRVNRLIEVERMRYAIATDLHDDIGSTLTSIALLSDVARNSLDEDPARTRDLLQRNATTARSLLDAMNDIVWSINPDNDALEQTLFRMQDFAARMFEAGNIVPAVEMPDAVDGIRLPMAVRRNVYLVFKELVTNVTKHSRATAASVRITMHPPGRPQELRVEVTDNGRGIGEESPNKGNGLRNMRKRAAAMDGTLRFVPSRDGGTHAVLQVPLRNHLNG